MHVSNRILLYIIYILLFTQYVCTNMGMNVMIFQWFNIFQVFSMHYTSDFEYYMYSYLYIHMHYCMYIDIDIACRNTSKVTRLSRQEL